jgi:hypothetical protein
VDQLVVDLNVLEQLEEITFSMGEGDVAVEAIAPFKKSKQWAPFHRWREATARSRLPGEDMGL